MASDYQAIRRDNERRYGSDIGRIGPMLLADRYDDRTHFIYELLQNAEDALAKRNGWSGQRSVRFLLSEIDLQSRHFGKPFDEADVRGICGIAESTKDLTAIGRFGIGFKSVYAFSDQPEVHSGTEDFAIESFVWPIAVSSVSRVSDETVIVIPLREPEEGEVIAAGLQRLGPGALLFLREIEEIEWRVEGGESGLYMRSRPEVLGEGVRRITVVGQAEGHPDIEQTWLLFSRPMFADAGEQVGNVEVAFQFATDQKTGREEVSPVSRSPLVVYFPTVVETHLGFLVQGPYRTTPSRDNVPHRDPWNQGCVKETANVAIGALRWLRDHDLLDVGTLRCLPLDPDKFGEGTMFAPVYEETKRALSCEPLLPRFGGGYVAAANAKLARTQELRELIDAKQLAVLFGDDGERAWLSSDISQDRTPELRQYLIRELDLTEITPQTLLSKLDVAFLEAQADEWVLKFYEFLDGQPALRAAELPLIRLADGRHVQARANGQPQAFLPGPVETGFPTVRAAVCSSKAARAFLSTLGLTEPDPVDDVIWNVLPKYREDEVDSADDAYEADIRRILAAFATDSKGQRQKLLEALRETPFVMAVDTGDGSECVARPGEIYLATDRLKDLFAGVPGVLRADDRYSCLRGEDVRELLEASGATRYLQPIAVKCNLSWDEKTELRRVAGLERVRWERDISDATLRGLDALLALIQKLPPSEQRNRASLLWQALGDVEDRRGAGAFLGVYTWSYSHETKTAMFDAAFVRLLNEKEWVPGAEGHLQRPEFVLFDSLGWNPNPFLQSKIRFKAPIIDQLAREAGIEPGVLDLLKMLGVTSEADLRKRLGMKSEPAVNNGSASGNVVDALRNLLGDTPPPTPPIEDPASLDPVPRADGGSGVGGGNDVASKGRPAQDAEAGGGNRTSDRTKGSTQGDSGRMPGNIGGRPFISYVAVHPDEEDPESDGLDHAASMALEDNAIDFIISREPAWHRTPTNNPGFDLYQGDELNSATRWCEVKAMTGSLGDRPVGLSRTQFDCARERGKAYWLYVVERAGTEEARLVRIEDPSGRAKTFTFDHGWIDVAAADDEQADRGK